MSGNDTRVHEVTKFFMRSVSFLSIYLHLYICLSISLHIFRYLSKFTYLHTSIFYLHIKISIYTVQNFLPVAGETQMARNKGNSDNTYFFCWNTWLRIYFLRIDLAPKNINACMKNPNSFTRQIMFSAMKNQIKWETISLLGSTFSHGQRRPE